MARAATLVFLAAAGSAIFVAAPTAAHACDAPGRAIGVSRVIEIDTRNGPLFGRATKFDHQDSILKPGEVVLTFDDGPTPRVTDAILKTLAEHCTRATFFVIGTRVNQFPDLLRDILRAGHTVGAHSWSHPNNLTRLARADAHDQIERGFAATDIAAGPLGIAPFFRFTGLNDGRSLLGYTQERRLGVFTVDVISNDSFARSASEIVSTTMSRVRANKGGILLFHDLRTRTARALPRLLESLKREGFKVVHVRATTPFQRDRGYDSALRPGIAAALKRRAPKADLASVIQPASLPASVPLTRIAPTQARFDPENDRAGGPADTASPGPADGTQRDPAADTAPGALRTTYGPGGPGSAAPRPSN